RATKAISSANTTGTPTDRSRSDSASEARLRFRRRRRRRFGVQSLDDGGCELYHGPRRGPDQARVAVQHELYALLFRHLVQHASHLNQQLVVHLALQRLEVDLS